MGIEERKHRDRERRIREILNAAQKLFLKKGILNTSMLDIAHQSDLSRRTLYLYFTSKDEIALRVIYEGLRKIKQRLFEYAEPHETAFGKLSSLPKAYISFYKEDFDTFHSTFRLDLLMHPENRENPDVLRCIQVITEIVAFIAQLLKDALAEDAIEIQGDVEKTAFVLMNMVHSSMERLTSRDFSLHGLSPGSGDEMIDLTFILIMNSLKKHEKSSL